MKVLIIVIAAAALLGISILVFVSTSGRRREPLSAAKAEALIVEKLDGIVESKKSVGNAIVGVDAPDLGIHMRHGAGEAAPGVPNTPSTPFHSASVGKMHTAAAVLALIRRGDIGLSDRLGDLVTEEHIEGLLIIDGKDLTADLTVAQLLSHRTGLADHFEDKTADGEPNTLELIAAEPNRTWTIQSRIDYLRDHYEPIGRPGADYHYADTNYDLLGLIIEAVTGKSFDAARRELVLEPAGMADSQAWPPEDWSGGPLPAADAGGISQVWALGEELSREPSISIDGPGGGLALTIDDQVRFMRSVVDGEALPELSAFEAPDGRWGRFNRGMDYGLGLMAIRPEKLSPFMKGYPVLYGHSGLTGAYSYYIPEYDAVITGTFNTTAWGRSRHVIFILEVMDILSRIERET